MFRFYVNEKDGNKFCLTPEIIKHIKVARVAHEQFICIYKGTFYITKLEGNKAIIIESLDGFHDFKNEVIIAASLINIKRFEWLIQKAAELGATKLIPIIANNMSVKMPHDISKKVKRWNDISSNASEQSFRNSPMIVENPIQFEKALKDTSVDNIFIAHEKVKSLSIGLLPTNSIFFVGPEGGFTDSEVSLAIKNGAKDISLGKRILRAETASLFILSRVK